ncbi:MAG: HEPN domain-containing protein [Desulfobulbaceae bacterium]|nr:HEPN domain-containing protein [Desulfobulbaceae bacterium]MCK5323236.1 HEPN domain-containing protein [Desulfobulbaceae bacterium]
MKDETTTWISYAAENLVSAKVLLERNLLNPCLQNIQQSVEKYLKAFLIENGRQLRRTHSINELVKMVAECHIQTGLSEEDCDLLDAIYLPSKYPLGSALPDFEPDVDLCRHCLALAGEVEKRAQKMIE